MIDGPSEPTDGHRPGPAGGAVARLRRDIRDHVAGDRREAASKTTFLAELDRLERPFDESAGPTHVTVSAIVVGSRGVILHRHRRLHRWLQPGGHMDPGETPGQTVVRECLEETGFAVTHPSGCPVLIHLDVHPAAAGHVHLDLRYLVEGPDEDPRPAPGESQDVAWFTWENAGEMAEDALTGALSAARRLVETSER
jgi:8-oxo-dGTP pyrophosphatase MutT (NUDIX family)